MRIGVIGAMALSMFACGSEPAPADLLGTWRTDARGYEGRTMRISADSIWFSSADGALTAFPVRDVRGDEAEVQLEYGEGRSTYVLGLVRLPDGLALRNQRHVTWERLDD